ncbi:hypothetical protein IFR05_012775 [Cadophora sp. M221]|nr:hypothetical protein IFR05_012775 [Cadophora sp. M221]
MASPEFEALFKKLALPPQQPYNEQAPVQKLSSCLAIFVLFTLIFTLIDNISSVALISMHIIAYCFCDFKNFPTNVAADILISTFAIIISIRLIANMLRLFNVPLLAKWTLVLAVAHYFVVGPEKSSSDGQSHWASLWNYSSSSHGQSHWDGLWNDAMRTFHTQVASTFLGLVGIVASPAEEAGYDSAMFETSAALFVRIRAGVEASVHHLGVPK